MSSSLHVWITILSKNISWPSPWLLSNWSRCLPRASGCRRGVIVCARRWYVRHDYLSEKLRNVYVDLIAELHNCFLVFHQCLKCAQCQNSFGNRNSDEVFGACVAKAIAVIIWTPSSSMLEVCRWKLISRNRPVKQASKLWCLEEIFVCIDDSTCSVMSS